MRHAFLFAFAAATFLFTGCDSLPDRLSTPFSRPQPKSHVFAADERTTFAAAYAALADLGFGYAHGGPAQGKLEALSSLQTGGSVSLNSTRQLQLEATFSPAPDGGTQVDVVLHEQIEDDSTRNPGQGTSTALSESSVYDDFFRAIEHRLAAPRS